MTSRITWLELDFVSLVTKGAHPDADVLIHKAMPDMTDTHQDAPIGTDGGKGKRCKNCGSPDHTAAQCDMKPGKKSVKKALEIVQKRQFSQDQRTKLADEGKAMSGGSFPIANAQDLKNAIQAVGRA